MPSAVLVHTQPPVQSLGRWDQWGRALALPKVPPGRAAWLARPVRGATEGRQEPEDRRARPGWQARQAPRDHGVREAKRAHGVAAARPVSAGHGALAG
jgi:hypothetical protein